MRIVSVTKFWFCSEYTTLGDRERRLEAAENIKLKRVRLNKYSYTYSLSIRRSSEPNTNPWAVRNQAQYLQPHVLCCTRYIL